MQDIGLMEFRSEAFELPSKITSIPPLAHRCSLRGMANINVKKFLAGQCGDQAFAKFLPSNSKGISKVFLKFSPKEELSKSKEEIHLTKIQKASAKRVQDWKISSPKVVSASNIPKPMIFFHENIDLTILQVTNDPRQFYIQIINKYLDKLFEMEKKIKIKIEKKSEKYSVKDLLVPEGSMVVIKDQEEWHRAELKEILYENEPEFCKIYLIDYGETIEKFQITENNLYLMDEEFASLACFAIKCKLNRLNTQNFQIKILSEAMKSLRSPHDIYEGKILRKEADYALIDILINGKHLTDLILEKAYAIVNPIAEEKNLYSIPNIDDNEVTVCKYFAANKECYKGKSCQFAHYYQSQNEVIDLYYKELEDIELIPNKSSLYFVEITHVTKQESESNLSGLKLFIRFPLGMDFKYPENSLKLIHDQFTYRQSNVNINQKMQLFYYQSTKKRNEMITLPGMLVAVLTNTPKDGWYRARVIENLEMRKVLVYLIDYGHEVVVSSFNIKKLSKEFLTIPCSTFSVHLIDAPKQCGSKIIQRIEEIVKDKTIFVKLESIIQGLPFVSLFIDGIPEKNVIKLLNQ